MTPTDKRRLQVKLTRATTRNFSTVKHRRTGSGGIHTALYDEFDVLIDTQDRSKNLVQRCLRHDDVVQDQIIDAGAQKTLKRILRRLDDRLALDVERGVDQHRHAGECFELLQKPVKPRIAR